MNATLFGTEDSMLRDAAISDCGRYRWSLTRIWKVTGKRDLLGIIMLNPSTADAMQDDPTIRKCIGYAKRWGFNGLTVRNLFHLRATDPKEMLAAADPVGPSNEDLYLGLLDTCPTILCAWGNHGAHLGRDRVVISLLKTCGANLVCLGVNRDGSPKHPLDLASDLAPMPFAQEGNQ